MHPPRIGIPLTLDDRGRWRAGRSYHYIDRRYADAIARAGGIPLQVPIQQDEGAVLDTIDGLLLPGGDDFASARPLPDEVELDLTAEDQLDFDRRLLTAARNRKLPILGICYGMQLIALEGGGALEAHLPSSGLDVMDHRLPDEARHAVEIDAESRLASLVGAGAKTVNSLHHQAVRSLGPDHRVAATSPDGVIEAIELRAQHEWEIGVQWHPEKIDDETSTRLFAAFVDACRRVAGEASVMERD